jgi:hypothetical protein
MHLSREQDGGWGENGWLLGRPRLWRGRWGGMEEEGRKMVSEAKVQRGLDKVLEREFPG